jgi:hypothetical protein
LRSWSTGWSWLVCEKFGDIWMPLPSSMGVVWHDAASEFHILEIWFVESLVDEKSLIWNGWPRRPKNWASRGNMWACRSLIRWMRFKGGDVAWNRSRIFPTTCMSLNKTMHTLLCPPSDLWWIPTCTYSTGNSTWARLEGGEIRCGNVLFISENTDRYQWGHNYLDRFETLFLKCSILWARGGCG